MEMAAFFAAELAREAGRSQRALEQMLEGQDAWKPHERSMSFGKLANMVATIPSWIALQVTTAELDVAPGNGSSMPEVAPAERQMLLGALDRSARDAQEALRHTTEAHLRTTWKLKAHGAIVQEEPRFVMIQDTFNHWAHHRGQLTVYLRLMGATVPAIFGPSADDRSFR